MPSIEINFNQEVNTSVQVGDEVYYIIPNTNGEFDWADKSNIFRIEDTATSPPTPYYVSDVSEGLPAFITVDFPTHVGLTLNIPPDGAFIMFGKDSYYIMDTHEAKFFLRNSLTHIVKMSYIIVYELRLDGVLFLSTHNV